MPSSLVGLPLEILVLVGLLVGLVLLNFTVLKSRPVTLLVALYIAAAVIGFAPTLEILGEVVPLSAGVLPIVIFGALTLVVFFILRRSSFFDPYIVPTGWELGVFALLQTMVIVAVLVQILPFAITGTFAPPLGPVLLDPIAQTALIAAPLLVFAFLKD